MLDEMPPLDATVMGIIDGVDMLDDDDGKVKDGK